MRLPRRQLLASAAIGLCGCLGDDDEQSSTLVDLPPGGPPDETIELAHWVSGDQTALHDAISKRLPERFSLELNPSASREVHERHVAEAIVAGRPPPTFQLGAGAALERYVTAVTLHTISDIVPSDMPASAESAVTIDGSPYAVPVTVDRVNWLFVRPELTAHFVDTEGSIINAVDRLTDWSASNNRPALAVPSRGEQAMRLFCLLFMARNRAEWRQRVADRTVTLDLLEDTLSLLAQLQQDTMNVTDSRDDAITAFRTGAVPAMFADQHAAAQLADADDIDWELLAFPGTADTCIEHVTGWGYPKRTWKPHGTKAVLDALTEPSCQREIAAATHTAPALVDPEKWDSAMGYGEALAAARTETATSYPAFSTGDGLASRTRHRLRETLSIDTPPVKIRDHARDVQTALND